MPRNKHAWRKGYVQKPWPRNPMETLYSDYFYFHFTNWPTPMHRNGCYICYTVKRTLYPPHVLWGRGVFENQFYPKERVHAELCFLNWFKNQKAFLKKHLYPGEKYHITWYISWSPCVDCSREVVEFLNRHKYVKLSIYTARLYHSNKPEHQEGLRSLKHTGADVNIMTLQDFYVCWETFVDHEGQRFWPWAKLDENSQTLLGRLMDILRVN